MTERAIGKMVEWIPTIKWSKGEGEQAAMFILDEARRLALEEAKEKPMAPASLVDEVHEEILDMMLNCGSIDGNTHEFYVNRLKEIDSSYHPSPQADIVGELKELLEKVNKDYIVAAETGDVMRAMRRFEQGLLYVRNTIPEIIRKHEGAK